MVIYFQVFLLFPIDMINIIIHDFSFANLITELKLKKKKIIKNFIISLESILLLTFKFWSVTILLLLTSFIAYIVYKFNIILNIDEVPSFNKNKTHFTNNNTLTNIVSIELPLGSTRRLKGSCEFSSSGFFFETFITYEWLQLTFNYPKTIMYYDSHFFTYINNSGDGSFIGFFKYYIYSAFSLIDSGVSLFILLLFNSVSIIGGLVSNSYLYTETPIFFLFFLFFILTTIFSLVTSHILGLYGVFVLNLISLLLFWLSSLFYFDSIMNQSIFYYINLGDWIFLNSTNYTQFDFYIDNVSYSFCFLTLSIGLNVYIYAFSYFRYEPLVDRLLIFLNCFIFSMIFLVTSGNLISIFLGWEMIGLTSFLLINFWSSKIATFKAAFKAYSFNKFSDALIFIVIILVFNCMYSFDNLIFVCSIDISTSYLINLLGWNISYSELIMLSFIIASFIKSAQFGFHIWLPDSMEAPVPASALIHSATLVSAGIYIFLRFSPLFESNLRFILAIKLVGVITAFYGGFVAMYQTDVKKILAYSTISHCGFLMVLYACLTWEYTIAYLYVHGFFKASSFMSIGNVIRFSNNNQDFRKMGKFFKNLIFDSFCLFIGLLNLSGIPFSVGFFIKHFTLMSLDFLNILIYCLCLIAASTSAFYCSKLYFNVFLDCRKAKKYIYTSYNSTILKSVNFKTSGLLPMLAISNIIILAYIINFNIISNIYDFKNCFSINSNLSYSTGILILSENYNELNNYSLINWVVVVAIISIIYSPWRILSSRDLYLKNFLDLSTSVTFFLPFFFFNS